MLSPWLHSHLLRRVGSRVVGVAVAVGLQGVVARVVSGERSGERGKRSGERAGVLAEEGAPALPPATSRARGCRQSGERGEVASAPPGRSMWGSTGARGGFVGGGVPSAEVTPRSRSRLPEHTGRSMASCSTSDEI